MPVETRKRKALAQAALEGAEPAPSSVSPPSSATKRQKKLVVRSKDAPEPAAKKNKVITFDDDGNADQELPVPASAPEPEAPKAQEQQPQQDDGDSDSDEAPEAVSTTKVAAEMKKSAQAEKKAAHEQAVADKEKRRQRDALFKQQASERKVEPQPAEEAAEVEAVERRRPEREIPTVLPAEFLTDEESEDDEDEGGKQRQGPNGPRRRNVAGIEKRLAREQRGPRDEVIGSTVYRVSRKVDERLAPKAKKHSKSSRELLLSRGRAPVSGRAGFFKK